MERVDGTQARLKLLNRVVSVRYAEVERVDGTQARLKLYLLALATSAKIAWKGWMGLRRD